MLGTRARRRCSRQPNHNRLTCVDRVGCKCACTAGVRVGGGGWLGAGWWWMHPHPPHHLPTQPPLVTPTPPHPPARAVQLARRPPSHALQLQLRGQANGAYEVEGGRAAHTAAAAAADRATAEGGPGGRRHGAASAAACRVCCCMLCRCVHPQGHRPARMRGAEGGSRYGASKPQVKLAARNNVRPLQCRNGISISHVWTSNGKTHHPSGWCGWPPRACPNRGAQAAHSVSG